MKPNTKKILKYILLIIVLIPVIIELLLIKFWGAVIVPWFPPYSIMIRDDGPSSQAVIDPPPITFTHPIYPADPTNNQVLMGAAHNVFSGRVIKQTGNKETEIGPRTQYSVEVIDSIKGNVQDTVTIDMFGGYNVDGKLVMVEESDPKDFLLQPGTTYLFATRYNEQENWYTIIGHPNARKILSTDANASIADLKTLVEKDQKFKTWEAAYPNEILDIADVASNNTKNNFKSLDAKSKAVAQSRADEARISLSTNAEAQ